MRDRVFYSICFGFVFGVLSRSFLDVNFYFVVLLGVISFALTLFFSLIAKNKWGIIASVFVLAFSFGVFRFHVADVPANTVLESQVGSRVVFWGEITAEPDQRENNQKLTVGALVQQSAPLVGISGGSYPTRTKILVTTNFDTDFKYGDRISFSGKLEKPENFVTDQGKHFDYINYLRKDDIFYAMYSTDAEIISRGHGNPIKNVLFYIKDQFLDAVSLAISRPESLLMGGLILGERSSFGAEMRQKFIDTGTIHIVALSGYNVMIVAQWIMKMFAFLPRNFGFGAGIVGILLFVVMAGGQATAVRAGVMACLALFARATGRNYDVARGLVLAGVIMIMLNPFVLAFDVSFQLSFIATVAVIFFSPRVEKYFLWVTPRFGLRDVVSVTFAAYVFVLPFILYKMGNLSLVALPANVLILPFIPPTMVFGFLTGFVGIISYTLSVPLGFVSYLFLHYELGVIEILSRVPSAAWYISNFPLAFMLVIYACFIYKLFGGVLKKFVTEPL